MKPTKHHKRQEIAKDRYRRLIEEMKNKGVSQYQIAQRIAKWKDEHDPNNEMTSGDVNQNLSKYKNETLRPDGNYKYPFTKESAKEVLEGVNKYSSESLIHAGADIRYQWLAGADDYKTYHEKFYNEYQKELEEDDSRVRARSDREWEEASSHLIHYAIDQAGLRLNTNVVLNRDVHSESDDVYHIKNYIVEYPDGHSVVLSPEEMEKMIDDIRSSASQIVRRVLESYK